MSSTATAACFALATACTVAVFSLIIRRGQAHGNAVTGVLIGLIVNVPPLAIATWWLWKTEWWNLRALLWFTAAGALGPTLGRVFYFLGIHHLGVARSVPFMAVGPLLTALMAVTFLGEHPTPSVWAGTVLIVLGCLAITYKRAGDTSWDRRYLWMPLASIVGFSISNVFRKVGVTLVPAPMLGITVTSLTGLFFLIALVPALPATHRPSLRWGKSWWFYGVTGTLNTLAFLSHFFAITYGDITIVTPISATSPFFALVLSALLMRDVERITFPVALGTLLTVSGGALIAAGIF